MTIQERIQKLRNIMFFNQIDAYIIPSADFHQSEYVGDYFKCREFISGFTGSAGTVVITHTSANLWTDGRYFLQAEKELENSEFILHKMGLSDTITIDDFLLSAIPNGGVLGFDGRVISASQGNHYHDLLAPKNIRIQYDCDMIDEIWTNRPQLPSTPLFMLSDQYTGETFSSKLARLRDELKAQGASLHLLTSLDDIAWLFNMRGNDVAYTPVFLSYAIVSLNAVHLFLDLHKLSQELQASIQEQGVTLHPYNDIYPFIQTLGTDETLLLDPDKCNFKLYKLIPSSIRFICTVNPTTRFKAQKNDIEIANIKEAHRKDAVAHTKFLYWLKANYKKMTITELSASEKLEELRKEQEHFLGPSFSPISAYGAHAAMVHYSSCPETNVTLDEGSFYLTDTGGHYLEGTTDITRTVALGDISNEMKEHYTNVLRGNLALSRAKFLYGCTGENLDVLARQFLWNSNLDYLHGTGHGIGNLLSVHEGPCNIKWKYRQEPVVLEPGMILSDEPGLYIENRYGIRLENILYVQEDEKNEYGQFMRFDTLTYVPFDLDAIDFSLLTEVEKVQLKQYHQQVYDLVSPSLTEAERKWLKKHL